ncbi:MAG: hypothetical protein DMG21_17745 [Acidobacteria bacterium]|nr:MAG: hypothetical protein DMG21_17745 [Acidobacteriota bacterium]
MKWYLINTKQRFRFALRNPIYSLKAAARELALADERFLAALTGTRALQVRRFLQEPFETSEFLAHLRTCEDVFRQGMVSADMWAKKVLVQYAAVRALRPETVVETGVASGVSSAYLLLALQRNQKGVLHSVEVGDSSYLPPGQQTGWLVPEWLRTRWRLHIGDAAELLPGLLQGIGPVDMFIHDSSHTYEQMKFEFELARPHIKRGGLLLADDALWNPAFVEFARTDSSPASAIIRGVGVLKT